MAREKAWRQLHKNAASNIEQDLEATPHKAAAVRPPPPITKTIQVRQSRHAGHSWRSRDELISDVLLWTPSHGRAKVGRPARTYIQQLCEDTGCSPEDLPEAMNDREGWWCPWCHGYRRRKWTRRHEFKSWTRLMAFHIALIPFEKGMNSIILPPARGK